MNDEFHSEELLKDLLKDAVPPGLRTELLNQAIRVAQRRARTRRALRTGLAMAGAAAGLVMALWLWSRPSLAPSRPTNPDVVHSEPVSRDLFVATLPQPMGIVHLQGASVATVRTSAGESGFERIDDEELLALCGNKPAALVYEGAGRAELVLLAPAAP